MVFDAIVACFGVDSSRTPEYFKREKKYSMALDELGHWNSVRITASDPEEVSVIVSKFKSVYTKKHEKVMIYSFQLKGLLTSEQIIAKSQLVAALERYKERTTHLKVDWIGPVQSPSWLGGISQSLMLTPCTI